MATILVGFTQIGQSSSGTIFPKNCTKQELYVWNQVYFTHILKSLHDHIISIRDEVLDHKYRLTATPFFIEVSVPAREVNC